MAKVSLSLSQKETSEKRAVPPYKFVKEEIRSRSRSRRRRRFCGSLHV
jgi:hypothetical protein